MGKQKYSDATILCILIGFKELKFRETRFTRSGERWIMHDEQALSWHTTNSKIGISLQYLYDHHILYYFSL
jgi:hypothetical protein